jgi:hypothetical protein
LPRFAILWIVCALSSCAELGPPPPDPILETDAVKDAKTAVEVAKRQCSLVADWPMLFSASSARLMGDEWRFGGFIEVAVSKRTGNLITCTSIEQ